MNLHFINEKSLNVQTHEGFEHLLELFTINEKDDVEFVLLKNKFNHLDIVVFKIKIQKIQKETFSLKVLNNGINKILKYLNGVEKFHCYFPINSILFETEVVGIDHLNHLNLKFPRLILEQDKRLNKRFIVDADSHCKLKIAKNFNSFLSGERQIIIEKPIYDLSINGISFLTNEAEKSKFIIGEYIKNATITFDDIKIQMDLKVASMIRLSGKLNSNYKSNIWKIGFLIGESKVKHEYINRLKFMKKKI